MLEKTWNNFFGQFSSQYKLAIHRDRIHGFHLGKKHLGNVLLLYSFRSLPFSRPGPIHGQGIYNRCSLLELGWSQVSIYCNTLHHLNSIYIYNCLLQGQTVFESSLSSTYRTRLRLGNTSGGSQNPQLRHSLCLLGLHITEEVLSN